MLKQVLARVSPAGEKARLSTLIFHRVLPVPDALFPEEPDAARFDAVCGWLGRWFNVLPLDEAVARLRQRSLPARALAITFDDGYADNHDVALPILQRHGLCATFFIATGFLDGGRMWNDSVIESVRRCASDAIELDLPADAGRIRLELGTMAERRAAIDRILAAIKYLPADERRAFTERLLRSLNVEADDRLMMTSEQVRALRRAGMQIGAHTVSHPILARLDDGAAYEEVARSKQALEALLGEPVPLFAYPNGRSGQDFTAASVDIARKAGFEAAVTTDRGAAHAATDRFRLPRYTPWERPRLRFGARLAQNLWQSNRSSAT